VGACTNALVFQQISACVQARTLLLEKPQAVLRIISILSGLANLGPLGYAQEWFS
jgi:hypothetical protein